MTFIKSLKQKEANGYKEVNFGTDFIYDNDSNNLTSIIEVLRTTIATLESTVAVLSTKIDTIETCLQEISQDTEFELPKSESE